MSPADIRAMVNTETEIDAVFRAAFDHPYTTTISTEAGIVTATIDKGKVVSVRRTKLRGR